MRFEIEVSTVVRRSTSFVSVLRDALGYAWGQGLQALVGVATVTLLARILGPREFGQYSVALVSVTLLVSWFSVNWSVGEMS